MEDKLEAWLEMAEKVKKQTEICENHAMTYDHVKGRRKMEEYICEIEDKPKLSLSQAKATAK